jgi:hypothetical protein
LPSDEVRATIAYTPVPGRCPVTLRDILEEIHTLRDVVETFERKYGVLSETFYEAYCAGEEPEDDDWVLDWAEWAGTYRILLRQQERYDRAVREVNARSKALGEVIAKAARREPIPVAA